MAVRSLTYIKNSFVRSYPEKRTRGKIGHEAKLTIKGGNAFAWGHEDVHTTLILMEPVLPEPVNSRGHMGFKRKDLEKVLSLMAVVYIFIKKKKLLLPWAKISNRTCGGRGREAPGRVERPELFCLQK
jgi:hypothetical protein